MKKISVASLCVGEIEIEIIILSTQLDVVCLYLQSKFIIAL